MHLQTIHVKSRIVFTATFLSNLISPLYAGEGGGWVSLRGMQTYPISQPSTKTLIYWSLVRGVSAIIVYYIVRTDTPHRHIFV